MIPEELEELCERTAAIDPWRTLKLAAEWLLNDLRNDPALQFFVVEGRTADGKPGLAGWISLTPSGALAHFRRKQLEERVLAVVGPGDGSYIRDLAVFPGWQGLGIGAILMDRAAISTRDAGLGRVFLSVSSFNEQATRFYEKRGFQKVLHLPAWIHPDHAETLLMLDLDRSG
jgi:ribosomal protein S18 acetylase RimI-like enzyme